MGLNVCIFREGPKGERIEHPDWDSMRMTGDRDLSGLMEVQKSVGHPYDFEFWQRPSDPETMRAEMEMHHPENSERWRQLEDILSDPDWWVYFSC